jgi:hypothetical protein
MPRPAWGQIGGLQEQVSSSLKLSFMLRVALRDELSISWRHSPQFHAAARTDLQRRGWVTLKCHNFRD